MKCNNCKADPVVPRLCAGTETYIGCALCHEPLEPEKKEEENAYETYRKEYLAWIRGEDIND